MRLDAGRPLSFAIASDSTTNNALTVVSGSPIVGTGTIHLSLGTEIVGLAGTAATGVISRTGPGVFVAATSSDITNALTYTPINKAGDTLSTGATLTFVGGGTVTGLPLPANPTDVATKSYVDAASSGLNVHSAVEAATTGNLAATYTSGTADQNSGLGIGATLTNAGVQAVLSIDGYAAPAAARVLIKNQTITSENGIYVVTDVGSVSTNWVLTRASDYNNSVANQVMAGDFVWVSEGGTLASTGWVETGIGTFLPGDVIILGTDGLTFTQFSGVGTYVGTSNQIDLTGSVFSLSTTIVTPGSFTASPLNANVTLSPTGTGTVTINPATAGTINNTSVGATTASTGRFTTVESTIPSGTAPFTVASTTPVANLSIGGNAATSTSSVSATNTTITASISNASFYPTFVSATAGNLPQEVSSGLTFNPSTNTLTTGVLSASTLNSTVVTGTAPFTVASTTPVANLSIGGTSSATNALNSATTVVSVSAATAPTAGQVLTATSPTAANWQTPTSTGSGATGGGTDHIFYENGQTITTSYTITTGSNAMSAGPITINTGVVVTIPTGSVWTVV